MLHWYMKQGQDFSDVINIFLHDVLNKLDQRKESHERGLKDS
jgi:hypothetical protein